jgi:transposase-like protein
VAYDRAVTWERYEGRRTRVKPAVFVSPEQKQEAVRLYRETDLSAREVAACFGVHKTTLVAWNRGRGLGRVGRPPLDHPDGDAPGHAS